MPLERLRVAGLRCLTDVDCRLDSRRNYFFGPNGAGKTSLLEAVYLLGRGRSFRTRQSRRLVQHGRDGLSVYAELRTANGLTKLGVQFAGGRISFRLDRRPVAGIIDIARRLRVDVIDPGVHSLIEGGPSERRRFVDWGVFHVEPSYLESWRRYRRALGQRNAELKLGPRINLGAVWDRALIDAAIEVDEARRRYVDRLAPLVAATGEALLRAPVSIAYRSGWRSGIGFAQALIESEPRDAAAGFTQVGPHRADVSVEFGGGVVGGQASRGQQKLVAAALVIAQIKEREGDRESILLVDDPAAELDGEALGRLMRELEGLGCQQLLTSLSADNLPRDPASPMFHVEQGHIEKCYNDPV